MPNYLSQNYICGLIFTGSKELKCMISYILMYEYDFVNLSLAKRVRAKPQRNKTQVVSTVNCVAVSWK